MRQTEMATPPDPRRQGRSNLRLGLLLASLALAFLAGFVVKMMFSGR